MNKLVIGLLVAGSFIACKNKKLDSTKAYFSVVDYLKAEVKKMDSMPLHFTKIATIDSTSDTSKITREEFHKYVQEFTSISDIASPSRMDDYKETIEFDEALGNELLIYTPLNDKGEITNETIMLKPDEQGNTHVETMLVTTIRTGKDSTVQKNMTWHIDQRFQIVTKVAKANEPEKVNTIIVQWE